jgi:hypothetical protein
LLSVIGAAEAVPRSVPALARLALSIARNRLPRMDTDQITIQLHRGAAAAVVHVLDYYIERDSGTGYGGILRSLQTTIIQDGFGGVKPGPPAGLPAHEQEE